MRTIRITLVKTTGPRGDRVRIYVGNEAASADLLQFLSENLLEFLELGLKMVTVSVCETPSVDGGPDGQSTDKPAPVAPTSSN